METISIAAQFSDTPGARYPHDGPYSGEDFRETLLEPAFRRAVEAGTTLVVDLDGAEGFGSSFLNEAFGGLARKFGSRTVQRHLRIIGDEDPYAKDEANLHIEFPTKHAPDGAYRKIIESTEI